MFTVDETPIKGVKNPNELFSPERLAAGVVSEDQLPEMFACPHCERSFAADRLDKHQASCLAAKEKRDVFNIKDQRVEKDAKKAQKKSTFEERPRTGEGAWREKHEEFIQTVREAKAGGGSPNAIQRTVSSRSGGSSQRPAVANSRASPAAAASGRAAPARAGPRR